MARSATKGAYVFALLLALLVLPSCHSPNDAQIRADFQGLFDDAFGEIAEASILSVFIGEGDQDNAYAHLRFRIVAQEDGLAKPGGCLSSLQVRRYSPAEYDVEMLYQRRHQRWIYVSCILKGS